MRASQKSEVLNFINSLHKAHEEIEDALNKGNPASLRDMQSIQRMLSECQEFAIELGGIIESLEGEGHSTVSHLERYCEALFHVHEMLESGTASGNKAGKILKKQLIQVENSAKNDIIIRKEIVFFPYKASMWDSLESVYLAAKEDKGCDVYCVPIPYFDLKPDHSFGEMHYEGREYPENIEVIDWKTYSFEERKPDMIFIHNPYDNWNYATSVHPRFYSENLKKYTEKLIYIPYFILGEIEPDNQAGIDAIKHFIWTPGVINADTVVVQSEKMKQIYVNEYWKAAKENGLMGKHLDRKYLERKFLGLGSPKIDRALHTKRDELKIPVEWLRIIRKPDGSWKTVIFYNTGLSALLKNNEKMLAKIREVLLFFRDRQDETALLWRPHPLIQATIASMRPGLWKEYREIVRQYREEGWGIYDDSPDVDRAVALCDGYFGDGSSVTSLCQAVGKPVMIQNPEILYREGIRLH